VATRNVRRANPRPSCSYAGCVRPRHSNGLCPAHNTRQKRGLQMDAPIGSRPATATISKTYAAIASVVTNQTAPINPDEVAAIFERMANAAPVIPTLDHDQRLLALLLVVCGYQADPARTERRARHQEHDCELAAA
jgi:hypothetical protein